ncbi:MAG: zinc ribbon domain-containing protein, partial [Pseudomonadota bacterium]|nr:zinc ribbon domain-containing protein [Pseudomonadota bacterium]
MDQCTNCGAPLEPGARFCPNCGAAVEPAAEAAPAAAEPITPTAAEPSAAPAPAAAAADASAGPLSNILTLARGAKGLALLCFVLPWMTVSCAGQKLVSMSGFNLATGNVVGPNPATG